MARSNKSLFAILGIISKSEVSGYDIKRILQKTSRFYWSESNAQIYPTLKQMEEKGCIVSRLDEASGARKCRKYSLTEKGSAVLLEWLAEPCVFSNYREEILLKVSLGQNMPLDLLVQHVKYFQKEVDERIASLSAIHDHINVEHADRPDKPFLFITYNQVSLVLHAKKQWVEETLKQLQTMKKNNKEK